MDSREDAEAADLERQDVKNAEQAHKIALEKLELAKSSDTDEGYVARVQLAQQYVNEIESKLAQLCNQIRQQWRGLKKNETFQMQVETARQSQLVEQIDTVLQRLSASNFLDQIRVQALNLDLVLLPLIDAFPAVGFAHQQAVKCLR